MRITLYAISIQSSIPPMQRMQGLRESHRGIGRFRWPACKCDRMQRHFGGPSTHSVGSWQLPAQARNRDLRLCSNLASNHVKKEGIKPGNFYEEESVDHGGVIILVDSKGSSYYTDQSRGLSKTPAGLLKARQKKVQEL
jgi:hypothetical protein